MKYIKILGLLAVAAAAMMALAGTASATVTSPTGTAYNGPLHATAGETTLHGGVTISCKSSTVEGTVTAGGTSAPIGTLTFSNCEPDTVTVVSKGTLEVVKGAETTADVISSGAEVTVVTHRTVLGFPITAHCIYKTANTKVGKLTEHVAPAVLHIGGAVIPRVATDGACGETSAWTGSYTVNTPKTGITVD